jgi:hypothetical protein
MVKKEKNQNTILHLKLKIVNKSLKEKPSIALIAVIFSHAPG